MADPKLTVTAKAEKASGEKTRAQEAAAREIEKKQREAAKKAEEARAEQARIEAEREAARKKAEEERKAAKEAAEKAAAEAEAARKAAEEAAAQAAAEEARRKEERKQQAAKTAAAGATLAAGAYQKAKSAGVIAKLGRTFIGGLLIGAVLGIAGGLFGGYLLFKGAPQPQESAPVTAAQLASELAVTVPQVEEADLTIDNDGVLGYTAADFQDAVLGGASEHQELIVFEQELSIPTTLTKSGLGNLAIFSKMKNITYYGTGVYTVDLSRMDSDHILVDEDDQVVTILIPHTVLQYVNAELEKTEFEETDKGLLSFGDIKLTPEETGILETAVLSAMRERLDAPDMYAEADRFATLKTWEIFQPLITAVSPAYKVEMVFE